jgi:hypothetical protein
MLLFFGFIRSMELVMDTLKDLIQTILGAQPGILALLLGFAAMAVVGYALHVVHLALRQRAR